jgi:hypothetical protein
MVLNPGCRFDTVLALPMKPLIVPPSPSRDAGALGPWRGALQHNGVGGSVLDQDDAFPDWEEVKTDLITWEE